MKAPSEKEAIRQVSEMLAEWFGVDAKDISRREPESQAVDAVFDVGKLFFVVEIKSSGAAVAVSEAAKRVRDYAASVSEKAVPIVVVPCMGEVGRRLCEEAGVQWLDLSGNARIVAPGVRVLIEGKPNRFKPADALPLPLRRKHLVSLVGF